MPNALPVIDYENTTTIDSILDSIVLTFSRHTTGGLRDSLWSQVLFPLKSIKQPRLQISLICHSASRHYRHTFQYYSMERIWTKQPETMHETNDDLHIFSLWEESCAGFRDKNRGSCNRIENRTRSYGLVNLLQYLKSPFIYWTSQIQTGLFTLLCWVDRRHCSIHPCAWICNWYLAFTYKFIQPDISSRHTLR